MAVCSELCGRFISRAVGNTNVLVTMKKMSRRNMTSVMEAMENIDVMSYCRFSAISFKLRVR